ncbi:immunoglobulin lambda-1 light chain [Anser cygnoides]|uniref:immunoglobulin lambda-1 light chain n=1 Tax=Anser cygnoides TaxID=8845 RepID=UPI0034D235E5
MLLLPILLAASSWSRGDAQAVPVQHPAMRTSAEGGSASMACRLTKEDTVHWYKQLPGEPPKRILYVSGKKPTFDDGTDEKKYQVRKHASEPHYSLTIDYVTQRDAGTYYCAYWYFEHMSGYYYEVFGSGTKLIVSDKGNSKPENSEILQTKHKDQLLYVCLIENFYPEVIRVQWVDGADKEVTKNVVKGDVWKSTNDKYSVSTWLTLPVNMTNKNYFCKYDHESQENFKLPIQDSSKTPSQEEYCSTHSGNSTVFYKDYLMHRAAHLVYLVLLLKSSMYYVIVLFFIYRTRTPAKLPGKKT